MEPDDVLSRTPEELAQECQRLVDILTTLYKQMDDDPLVAHDTTHHMLQLRGAIYELDNKELINLDFRTPVFNRILRQARVYTRALQWTPAIDLLKWAYNNMTFTLPVPDPDSEYEFCNICNMPEWMHDGSCAGEQWRRKVEITLNENK